MKEYKKIMCSTCNNKNCIEKIHKTNKQNIITIKCDNYIKPGKSRNNLSKYINEIK